MAGSTIIHHHPLLAEYTQVYNGGLRNPNSRGEYQLYLLPPEGTRGGVVLLQGFQSNCNTHNFITEGALLDENGNHRYPIHGPTVTVHCHFGVTYTALGAVRVPVRLVGNLTGGQVTEVTEIVCVVVSSPKKDISITISQLVKIPGLGAKYAWERLWVFADEYLPLAQRRERMLKEAAEQVARREQAARAARQLTGDDDRKAPAGRGAAQDDDDTVASPMDGQA